MEGKNTTQNKADTHNIQYPFDFDLFPLDSGEGMSGCLFWKDLISLAHSVGFSTPHLVSASRIVVHNNELKEKAGKKKGKKEAILTFNDRSFSFYNLASSSFCRGHLLRIKHLQDV